MVTVAPLHNFLFALQHPHSPPERDFGRASLIEHTMTTSHGTIFLTGANGGLGTAIVDDIVSRSELSGCHGIYTVRDANTATALHSTLRAAKSHSHEILSLDLSNLANVRRVAATVNAKVGSGEIPRIRALFLNAAYREHQGQTRTEGGLNIAFASNYLGHWLLVLLLLESMEQESGRIVVVGSWVHELVNQSRVPSVYYLGPNAWGFQVLLTKPTKPRVRMRIRNGRLFL